MGAGLSSAAASGGGACVLGAGAGATEMRAATCSLNLRAGDGQTRRRRIWRRSAPVLVVAADLDPQILGDALAQRTHGHLVEVDLLEERVEVRRDALAEALARRRRRRDRGLGVRRGCPLHLIECPESRRVTRKGPSRVLLVRVRRLHHGHELVELRLERVARCERAVAELQVLPFAHVREPAMDAARRQARLARERGLILGARIRVRRVREGPLLERVPSLIGERDM